MKIRKKKDELLRVHSGYNKLPFVVLFKVGLSLKSKIV
jgi:hypothetical protein